MHDRVRFPCETALSKVDDAHAQKAHVAGFTLLEILAALAVVAVATTILLSMFGFSLEMVGSNRNHSIAASLAEEQLEALVREPGRYDWPLEGVPPGELVEVALRGKDDLDARRFSPPAALPLAQNASAVEEQFYEKFSWRAFARRPRADAQYVEATVVVDWSERGRSRMVSLTSIIAWPLLASAAQKPEGSQ